MSDDLIECASITCGTLVGYVALGTLIAIDVLAAFVGDRILRSNGWNPEVTVIQVVESMAVGAAIIAALPAIFMPLLVADAGSSPSLERERSRTLTAAIIGNAVGGASLTLLGGAALGLIGSANNDGNNGETTGFLAASGAIGAAIVPIGIIVALACLGCLSASICMAISGRERPTRTMTAGMIFSEGLTARDEERAAPIQAATAEMVLSPRTAHTRASPATSEPSVAEILLRNLELHQKAKSLGAI